MNIFEQASKIGLRFSFKGILTVEDLWHLGLQELNRIAVSLSKEIKEAGEENFLEESKTADVVTKLKFDIVLHILNTKKEEMETRKTAKAKREEKARLLELLEQKKLEKDGQLSETELLKKIEALD